MIESNPDDELWRAYESTCFRAETSSGTIEIRIGAECLELTRLLAEKGKSSWCFITAWNPGNVRPGAIVNEQRNAALRSELTEAGFDVFDGCGHGQDPTWEPEKSFLVLGISQENGVERAQRYGQYAIAVGEFGGAPRLVDCRPSEEQLG